MKLENRVIRLEGIAEKSRPEKWVHIIRYPDEPDNETAIRRAGYDPGDPDLNFAIRRIVSPKSY